MSHKEFEQIRNSQLSHDQNQDIIFEENDDVDEEIVQILRDLEKEDTTTK